jgi:hypothetical protein
MDIETGCRQARPLDGFPLLANFIASDGDLETKQFAINWESFRDAAIDLQNAKQKKRMQLMQDIRA